ncbi:MAG: CDP-alcohol phosphatidyltransferase family protein [Pseudomonadota bacterium]
MFDTRIRNHIDPPINRLGAALAARGVRANHITWAGFFMGALAALAIAFESYGLGLVLLLASRLMDALDGAVARATEKTDLGGFLDIVLDFAFYGLIPVAFILANPEANAVAGATVLLAFYINGASFLTYALMAEKRGIDETARGSKSLLYTTGLAEAAETIIVFVLWCLFPSWFAPLAYVFAAIVAVTTASRIVLAYREFS